MGLFSTAAATNGTDVTGTVGENKVSFTDLYPGATYNVSLYYQLNQQDLLQCSHSLTLSEFVSFPHLSLYNIHIVFTLFYLILQVFPGISFHYSSQYPKQKPPSVISVACCSSCRSDQFAL